jgi:hypothetical protein
MAATGKPSCLSFYHGVFGLGSDGNGWNCRTATFWTLAGSKKGIHAS